MTSDGLTRLTELFKNDIIKVEYDVDGVTTEETNLTFNQNSNILEVEFFIPTSTTGVIDNFKLVGATITYDIKNKTYNKTTDDAQKVSLPYKIETEVI